MGLECELKYLDVDLDELRRRLNEAGGTSSGRYFEYNLVFDREGRVLKAAGVLLRLRKKRGQCVLTVKRPPEVEPESALKVFEEIETSVGDFSTMKLALEALGFSVAFAYEKEREKWKFMDCTICLDRLPFGDYVEIEGMETTVFRCADILGIADKPTSKMTYHAINIEYRSEKGLDSDENFVFSDAERAEIIRQIGKDSYSSLDRG